MNRKPNNSGGMRNGGVSNCINWLQFKTRRVLTINNTNINVMLSNINVNGYQTSLMRIASRRQSLNINVNGTCKILRHYIKKHLTSLMSIASRRQSVNQSVLHILVLYISSRNQNLTSHYLIGIHVRLHILV